MVAYRPSLWLELIADCNLSCDFCYNPWRPRDKAEAPGSVSSAELLQIATRLSSQVDFEYVALSGGEPLMYEGLDELIGGLAKLGHWTVLTTNGTMLTATRLRELREAGLSSVQVSLTSIRERVHNELTRSHSWKSTIAAIARSAVSGLPTTVVVTATAVNLPDLVATASFLRDSGVHRVVISRLQLSGSAIDNADRLDADKLEVLAAIDAVIAEVGAEMRVDISPPLVGPRDSGWHRWAVAPDGVLKLCNMASSHLGEVTSMPDETLARIKNDWSVGNLAPYGSFADTCGCFARRMEAARS